MSIFFIKSEGNESFIKIGYSSNVNMRFKSLQTSSPVKLTFICSIPGEIEDEICIKKKFASLCVRGEWFRPDDILLEFIRSICASKKENKLKPRINRSVSGASKNNSKKQAAVFIPKDFLLSLNLCDYDRHSLRNKAIIWFSFGCGLRVTEIALLKVKDVISINGNIVTTGWLPGTYSKNKKGRNFYVVEDEHIKVIDDYIVYRINHQMKLDKENEYRGLAPDSPFIMVTKHRGFSFRYKYYTNENGEENTYKVCSSLQQLLTNLLKRAGVRGATSHSGRRTLATRLSDRGVDIGLIQHILGHSDEDQTVDYIEPNENRVRGILKNIYGEL